jgi:penicillin-binding protein 1B
VVADFHPEKKQVVDQRVAYVMTNMMEGVLNFGTAYEVRQRGFTAPAAGKTGTSHDGWFAGYTSNLLCIVWVGYDDYSDIRLSGAQTAAPIWAEFMKKAVMVPQYSNDKAFSQPDGVVDVQLDKITNLLASPACPETYTAAFIAGTEPNQTCDQGTGMHGFFSRIFGGGGNDKVVPPPVAGAPPNGTQAAGGPAAPGSPGTNGEDAKKKKGFFGKIAGIFKDDKTSNPPPAKPPDKSGTDPH